MCSIRLVILLALVAPLPGAAQSASGSSGRATAQDTTQPAPKKKGGLFGKMKGLSKSKLVNTVAKTALCTAVPGGSMLAGAIDAKKAKNVAGAAGAAANVAAGSSGSCMPGLGLAQKVAPATNPAAAVAGVGVPGLPTTGVQGPAVTAAQLKQMEDQYRKMGMSPEQIQMMKSQMTAMQQGSPPSSEPEQTSPEQMASSPVVEPVQPVLKAEAGRITLLGLPWIRGGAGIRPGAEASFGLAMRDLASAIQHSTKHYRVEVRVEEQGKKSVIRALSRQRAAAVVKGLLAEGIPAQRLKTADGGADRDPRVLVEELK